MLVLGACEQHGYLSLLTDVKIPLALADAASQRSGRAGRAAAELWRFALFSRLTRAPFRCAFHLPGCGRRYGALALPAGISAVS
jgi:hypothetical protein